MNVALTGTPGTGKSTVSKLLRESGYQVIDLNEVVLTENLISSFDTDRNTSEVDLDRLDEHLKKILTITDPDHKTPKKTNNTSSDFVFLEGHLAHLLNNMDLVIILRCHPDELRHRLVPREWPADKVRENLEAEAVDAITIECVDKYEKDNLFEIDTTKLKPQKIMEIIMGISNGTDKGNKPGNIDWSEEILKWY